jgi:hypothetical protein
MQKVIKYIETNFIEFVIIVGITYIIFSVQLQILVLYFNFYKESSIFSIILLIFINFFFLIILIKYNLLKKVLKEKPLVIVILITFLFSFLSIYYFHWEQVEGGHDQGNLLNHAIIISKRASLKSSNNPVIDSYPGWEKLENGHYLSPFYPFYSVYLSQYIKFIGFKGVVFSNFILIFLIGLILYSICKNLFCNKIAGLLSVIMLFTTFSFNWFFHSTFSENVQLPLTLAFIYTFIKGYTRRNYTYLLIAFAVLSSLLLVRVETPIYIIFPFLLLTYRIFFFKKELGKFKFTILNAFFMMLILAGTYSYFNYLTSYSPSYFNKGIRYVKQAVNNTLHPSKNTSSFLEEGEYYPFNQRLVYLAYLFGNMKNYNLIVPIVLVFIYFLNRIENLKKNGLFVLLVSPSFIFLIHPFIAPKHPWYMRKFLPVFMPTIYVFTSMCLTKFIKQKKKPYYLLLPSVIIICNIVLGLPSYFHSRNNNIPNKLHKIDQSFSKNDVVFFYSKYDIDNWAPSIHFRYGTNIILDRKFRLSMNDYKRIASQYENAYVVFPFKDLSKYLNKEYQDNLQYKKTITINTNAMSTSGDIRMIWVEPELFKSYYEIYKSTFNSPPIRVNNRTYEFNIYKIKL